jgi:prepilin-type processing-associated H-X9-DG protein
MRTHSRRGFTLFQLLIILAVLAILLGLLLPAVAKVRSAAARTQSANNLKQIGIACHNYLAVYNLFPPGVDDKHFSTAAYVLPFLEQDNLFKTLDFKKPVEDKANAAARKTLIQVFLSPLDEIRAVSPDFGATNYLFNAGSKPALKGNDGVFFQDSKVRITDITDGTSNTLLSGETLKGDNMVRAVDVHRQMVRLKEASLPTLTDDTGSADFKNNTNIAADRCASWMDGRFLQGTFSATRKMNDSRPDVDCGGAGGLSGLRTYQRGTNVGMADGSVRYLVTEIDPNVFKALSTRSGGEVINPNDL